MVGRGMGIWSRAREWRPSTYANVQVTALIWGKLLEAYASATDNSYTSFLSNWSVSSSKTVKNNIQFKKEGEIRNASNYRPVSFLPISSKIFEKSFLNRTLNFLTKHKTISSKLVGLRIGKSTLNADVSLVDTVGGECGVERESGDRRQGMQMCSGAVLCRKPHSAQLRLCLRLHLFRLSTVHQTAVKSILDRLVGR